MFPLVLSEPNYNFHILTVLNIASLSASRIGPYTSAGVFIEMETSCAFYFNRLAFYTIVEYVANGGVRVGEESVTAWALVVWLCGFYGQG